MKIVNMRLRWYALAALTLSYPLLVYLGIAHLQPRWLAALLAVLAILRAVATRERIWLLAAGGALSLALMAALGNQLLPLKLYPVLVSGLMLTLFLGTLFHPPSAIERVARLRHPTLPAAGVAYTRRVTQVWCGFFAFNAAAALYTALYSSAAVWALYNGCISYVLTGCLFAGEWLLRQRVQARIFHA